MLQTFEKNDGEWYWTCFWQMTDFTNRSGLHPPTFHLLIGELGVWVFHVTTLGVTVMWHESVVDAGGRYPSKSWCQSSTCGWPLLHGAWINLPLKKKLVRQEIGVKNCQNSISQFSQSCTVAKSMLLCCRTNGWPHTKRFHSLGFILT